MTTEEFSLPRNWVQALLEDVCDILDSVRVPVNAAERRKRSAGKRDEDLYRYYGATGQVGVIDGYLFDGEYVLIGEDGAPFLDPFRDTAYIVSGQFWVNNHAHILRSHLSNKYLCFYLNQVDYSEHVTGTTRLKLTQAALRQIPVRIAPTNEQHRIVKRIEELFSELDKGAENLRTAQGQLNVYWQAVLKHAFEGKLTAQWREENERSLQHADQLLACVQHERRIRYQQQLDEWEVAVKVREADRVSGRKPAKPTLPKHTAPITSEVLARLPTLPNGWCWARLADLFSMSPQNGLYKPATDYGGGTTIVRIDDFYDGRMTSTTGFKRVRLTDDEVNAYRIEEGDLIINRVNSIEYLGKCALVPALAEAVVFESNIMKCRIVDDLLSKEFITFYLASHEGRSRLCANAKHAVNQASINQSDVGNTPVPLPSFTEQIRIVQLLEQTISRADALMNEIEIQLQKSSSLRQSILRKAFAGRLVGQDPKDEPASVLLARIKGPKGNARRQINNKKDAA